MRKTLIKRKKSGKSKKHNRRTRKMVKRGGGKWDRPKKQITTTPYKRSSGSDMRQKLVDLCRDGKWDEYDAVTQEIIKEYRQNDKKDFFYHLKNQIKIKYGADGITPEIESTTFGDNTLLCLERSLTQLQEDGIPESMIYLHVISDMAKKRSEQPL